MREPITKRAPNLMGKKSELKKNAPWPKVTR